MRKGVVVFFALVIIMPVAYSLSLKELVSRYLFSFSSDEISILNYTDYMADMDSNGINDTLVIELTANANGNFIFVVNVLDKNGILFNETNATFSGTKKLNATFSSFLLSQGRFNYSIKAYNSTNSLKYRKDNILTNAYANYEEGFSLLGVIDYKTGNRLAVNATVNSSLNGTFQPILFMRYNSSAIYSKQSLQIINGENNLAFEFDNDTIKKTHYNGKYNISSLKIGGKTIKTDYTTSAYSFRDFASSSYIYGFNDGKLDSDADGQYDSLQINASVYSFTDNLYHLKLHLYDVSGNIIEIKNVSALLDPGNQIISANINGTKIYNKKLNGPYAVKYIELYENYTLADKLNDAYTTSNYNFNDFYAPGLPDVIASISVSDSYHYGINNLTANVTLKNAGNKPAFNLFFDIFDNNTMLKTNKSTMLSKNSEIFYQFNFTNASDFEISAIADFQGLIDESNESNNAEKISIKINRKPSLLPISNIAANETDEIILNLSASDPNEDNLKYFVNLSKFSNQASIFRWQTTTMDSGNYTIVAAASDGYLNDSIIFNVAVIDAPDKDSDNDGINDTIDKVIGNEKSINTSTFNLRLLINSSSNLSRLFGEQATVNILDGNFTIAEFEFNFSSYRLNLTNITIDKQASNSTGSLIFSGLGMPPGFTKTLYLDRINSEINGICIKDDEIASVSEISGDCNSNTEFKIECDGTPQNSYKCAYNLSSGKYKVEGLKHSGIIQFSYSKPQSIPDSPSASGSSSGSSSGGGIFCKPEWQCGKWSDCADGLRERTCSDKSQCPFTGKKPEEKEKCEITDKNHEIQPKGKIVKLEIPINFAKDKLAKGADGLSLITGKAIDKVTSGNSYSFVFVLIGIIILVSGYFIIRKYRLD